MKQKIVNNIDNIQDQESSKYYQESIKYNTTTQEKMYLVEYDEGIFLWISEKRYIRNKEQAAQLLGILAKAFAFVKPLVMCSALLITSSLAFPLISSASSASSGIRPNVNVSESTLSIVKTQAVGSLKNKRIISTNFRKLVERNYFTEIILNFIHRDYLKKTFLNTSNMGNLIHIFRKINIVESEKIHLFLTKTAIKPTFYYRGGSYKAHVGIQSLILAFISYSRNNSRDNKNSILHFIKHYFGKNPLLGITFLSLVESDQKFTFNNKEGEKTIFPTKMKVRRFLIICAPFGVLLLLYICLCYKRELFEFFRVLKIYNTIKKRLAGLSKSFDNKLNWERNYLKKNLDRIKNDKLSIEIERNNLRQMVEESKNVNVNLVSKQAKYRKLLNTEKENTRNLLAEKANIAKLLEAEKDKSRNLLAEKANTDQILEAEKDKSRNLLAEKTNTDQLLEAAKSTNKILLWKEKQYHEISDISRTASKNLLSEQVKKYNHLMEEYKQAVNNCDTLFKEGFDKKASEIHLLYQEKLAKEKVDMSLDVKEYATKCFEFLSESQKVAYTDYFKEYFKKKIEDFENKNK